MPTLISEPSEIEASRPMSGTGKLDITISRTIGWQEGICATTRRISAPTTQFDGAVNWAECNANGSEQ
jgi:hypothetical protein